jgi:hypothetical protein
LAVGAWRAAAQQPSGRATLGRRPPRAVRFAGDAGRRLLADRRSVRFAGARLAVVLRLAVDRFAAVRFAGARLAVVFRFAAVRFAGDRLAVVLRFAGDRFAVERFAVDFLAAVFRFAGDCFAGERFAVVLRFAGDRFAVVRFAVDFLAAVFRFAVDFLRPVLDRAEERVRAGTVRDACSCCSVSPNPSGPPADHSVGESATSDSLGATIPLQSSWVIDDLLGLICVARFPTTVSL